MRSFLVSSVLMAWPISEACAARPDAQEISFVAVGDVMLGRGVHEKYAGDIALAEVGAVLESADVVFGNLEACFSKERRLYKQSAPFPLRASDEDVRALKRLGFTVLSLANNHCLDFGTEAIAHTKSLLQENGLNAFGAGRDQEQARRPMILTIADTRVGFLGYSADAGSESPVASLDRRAIADDVAALKKAADFIVVSFHWGQEYSDSPTSLQEELARAAIDAGADLILGHHPHVLQKVGMYKGKLIFYSLGNFIFDQTREPRTQSVIVKGHLRSGKLVSVDLYPVQLSRYLPRIPSPAESRAIRDRVDRLSGEGMGGIVTWHDWR